MPGCKAVSGVIDWTSLFVLGGVLVATFVAGWSVGRIIANLSERIVRLEDDDKK